MSSRVCQGQVGENERQVSILQGCAVPQNS